jgi:hypothetical protein
MPFMATLQLSLPDKLKIAAEVQAVAAGCASVDDYIARLIEADELPPLSDEVEARLLQGLHSGPAVPITPEFIAALKRTSRAGLSDPA